MKDMKAKQPRVPKSPETTFAAARSNLLLMLAFTAVNVILRIAQANLYFLFSASMPMAALDIGVVFEEAGLPGAYIAGIVVAIVIVVLYLLCWLLSNKRRGWMVVALVLFALDTLLMFLLYEITADMVLDVLFHAYVLYYLISGTVAMAKLKNQPEPVAEELPYGTVPAENYAEIPAQPYGAVPAQPYTEAAPVAATVMNNGEPVADPTQLGDGV